MLPYNHGGHSAYQNTFVSDFLTFYSDPFVFPKSIWDYIVHFWYLDLSLTDSIMQECYSVYDYCQHEGITPFIDLNPGHTGHFTSKDDFTIDGNCVPVCKMGLRMHKDGYEATKHRAKYRYPKADRRQDCFFEHPCSPAKYGRTIHIYTDNNPKLFNTLLRNYKAWKKNMTQELP